MNHLFSVEDQVVFITGASANIGKVLAMKFAENGAKVILGNTNKASAAEIIGWFEEKGYEYLWIGVDVSREEQVRAAFEQLRQKYGRLDIMINNASTRVNQTALEHGIKEWDNIFAVNIKGTMMCAQEACKMMKEQGAGKIINTSSISAIRGIKMRSSYCATKGAVDAYTRAAAVEWAPYGITVNAIAWGGVDVDEIPMEKMSEGHLQTLSMVPIKKLANADMLYGPVAFLASKASAGITGQTIMADGGWRMVHYGQAADHIKK